MGKCDSLGANKKSPAVSHYKTGVIWKRTQATTLWSLWKIGMRFYKKQMLLTSQPITTYNNFVLACKNVATDTIPLKSGIKKHKPWQTEVVVWNAKYSWRSSDEKVHPSDDNIQNFDNAQIVFTETYEKEQIEYMLTCWRHQKFWQKQKVGRCLENG